MNFKQTMQKILMFILILFTISVATAVEQATIYDLTNMQTDNYQGDIIIISGMDYYNWGDQLGYLGQRGFVDKNKKVTGDLGIRFIPILEDNSYCKTRNPCSWEAHEVTFDTDVGTYTAYIPGGNEYITDIYFYVDTAGSTYWAKSGHETEHISTIDLTFEDAVSGDHLARASVTAIIEPVSNTENVINVPEADIEAEEAIVELISNQVPIILSMCLLIAVVAFIGYDKFKKQKVVHKEKSTPKTKPSKKTQVSARKRAKKKS